MTLLQALALAAAGLAAGTASAMAGGASIITFPVLLAMGVPPLTANVTNTVGLAPIVVGTALNSAPELRGQRARLTALGPTALVGGAGLSAAFLAADADESVRYPHLLRAARSEYAKLEKTLTEAESGGWE